MQFNMKQTLYEGDLCILDGYGNRVWEVVGFTFEKSKMSGKITEEIIYNLACIMSTEWNIGVQEETTLVCKAKYAYQYVRELNEKGLPPAKESNGYISPQKGELIMKAIPVSKDGKDSFIYPDTTDGLLMKISDLICRQEALSLIGEENPELQLEIDKTKEEILSKNVL